MLGLQVAAVLILTAFLYWAAWVWPTLSFGFWSAVFGGIGFMLPIGSLAAGAGVLLALVGVVEKAYRARAARLLGLALAVIAGTGVGGWLGPVHKMHRIREVASATMPFVLAIEAFERDQGRPPHDLHELVPRYIPAIPSTGMRGFSEWDYIRGTDARACGENSWVLLVHTGGPGINFDQLMYFQISNTRNSAMEDGSNASAPGPTSMSRPAPGETNERKSRAPTRGLISPVPPPPAASAPC